MKEPLPVVCSRFHQAVELIGGRWTGAIIQALLGGPTRYGAIRSRIPEISDRMLSDRLRVLEMEGLVDRRVVPETPVRIEYELTEKGRSLDRSLGAIAEWAERWIPAPEESPGAPNDAAKNAVVGQSEPAAAAVATSRQFVGKPRIKPKPVGN